jgi:hypothetical protein
MNDEDTTDAQWAQQEQDERSRREDEQIRRCRNTYGAFRHECDEFSASFNRSMRTITKGDDEWQSW